ncbi:MAG: hypothetical protein BWY50_02160 [Spirochaetes bacterium ADurb.Bin315]|nr:MAG: hypothetical protein BWY50_02160 [Spirochaetes bacterium ADurb.Bin315]
MPSLSSLLPAEKPLNVFSMMKAASVTGVPNRVNGDPERIFPFTEPVLNAV